MTEHRYDVVVVGGSLAGCTAARLFAQQGLSVALVEKHRDPAHYKRLCTHFIQASARPTIERLGLAEPLEGAGAVRTCVRVWTRWGWVTPPTGEGWGYNVRRQTLEPMLRDLTLATPGVEGYLGWTVRQLVDRDGRIDGVVARDRDGEERTLYGSLVVGADGAGSKVAELAGVGPRVVPNERFGYFAHFRGIERPAEGRSLMWMLEPDIAYVFPSDDGVTLLAAMPSKKWLPAFDDDRQGTFDRYVRSLPEAPDLTGAEQVTPLVGTRDYPLRSRPVAPQPGLALIGDAARTSDPVWGVGCGWAFQSAEWLVDATSAGLRASGVGLAEGIRAYRRRHRHLAAHDFLIADHAKVRDLNPVELSVFSAATRDEETARRFEAFGARTAPAWTIMSPALLTRTTRVNREYRRAAGSAPVWRPASGVRRGEIEVDGLRSPMLEAGSPEATEAVVCVHGNSGSREDFGQLVERVGGFARAVAVDMPGFGHADKPSDFPSTVQGYADHLARVLAHLGIERAHLVVHDFGGAWGLRWAADHPSDLASLTLVNAGVTLGCQWHLMARIWRTPGLGEAFMATTTRRALHTTLQIGAPRGLPRSYTSHMYDTFDEGTRRAVLGLYRATPDIDEATAPAAEALRQRPVPVLVVWGRHDPYLPLAQAYRQRDAFPDARIEVLEHSGHFPFIDDPDTFLRTVVPFLHSTSARGTDPAGGQAPATSAA
jgi:menaquinone-9 beta-reductase